MQGNEPQKPLKIQKPPILFNDHVDIVSHLLEENPDLLANKLWRIQNLYPIQDKLGRITPFKLNEHQMQLLPMIKENWQTTIPEPIVILKSRQVGITTFFCLWYLDDVLTYNGISAAIQAHKRESMNDIFKVVRLAYDQMHPVYKKKETYKADKKSRETKSEITIGENNSIIEVKLEVRSKAVNRMHYSEYAFTEEDRITATQGSLAPNCIRVYESTPKGLNHFHKLYRKNKPKGNCFFIPWWKHAEYAIACPGGLKDKTREETGIQKMYPEITDEKLMFRRKKIDEMKLLPFEQEYPLNDVECFLLSGASLLDRRLLAEMEAESEKIPKVSYLKLPNWDVDFYELPTMEDLKNDPRAYFIGVDTAEGIGQDYSVTVILSVSVNRNYEVNQAMIARGFLPPDDQAIETYKLVKKHYVFDGVWPFLVCERNNTGHAFLSTMQNHPDYFYPNLYYFQDKRVGFKTTQISRKIIIHDLFNAIRGRSLVLKDTKTIGELLTLTLTESGKIEAEEGEHDDLVIGNALAYHGFFHTLGQGRFIDEDKQVGETDAGF